MRRSPVVFGSNSVPAAGAWRAASSATVQMAVKLVRTARGRAPMAVGPAACPVRWALRAHANAGMVLAVLYPVLPALSKRFRKRLHNACRRPRTRFRERIVPRGHGVPTLRLRPTTSRTFAGCTPHPTTRPCKPPGLKKRALRPALYYCLLAAIWAATSAAKSSTFFSMPSPTTYMVKPLTVVLAAFSICSIDCLSFFTNAWFSSDTSFRYF